MVSLSVDNVVVCAGQLPYSPLAEPLISKGIDVHLIGGAKLAKGLDAQRAIREGMVLASKLADGVICQVS